MARNAYWKVEGVNCGSRLRKLTCFLILFAIFLILAKPASALLIKSVDVPDINPGENAILRIEIENDLKDDIKDVSLSLNLQDLPLSTIGSSEDSVDEIQEDDDENFVFRIRASPTAKPGDYQIPYTLTYKNLSKPQTGSIGIRIKGNVELSVTVSSEKPVLNQKDKLSLKIINKGFANARYVSIKLIPQGFSLNSPDSEYIGDINANDFETASFEVVYTSKAPRIEAKIEYLDFNNAKQIKIISESFKVYTKEQAIERGIIQKNYIPYYITVIILIILVWLIWRAVRKRLRKKRSMQDYNSKGENK